MRFLLELVENESANAVAARALVNGEKDLRVAEGGLHPPIADDLAFLFDTPPRTVDDLAVLLGDREDVGDDPLFL